MGLILEMATLVGVVVILAGGKSRREAGWGVLVGLLAVVGLVLFGGMGVVVSTSLRYFVRLRCKQKNKGWDRPACDSRAWTTFTDTCNRHICLRLASASRCRDGGWIRRGFCALLVAPLWF